MKDVISIVGAGGKTTVLNLMAKNISRRSKVLLSTTTKMKLPSINEYDILIINKEDFEKYKTYFLKHNILIRDMEFLSSNLDFKKISKKEKRDKYDDVLFKKEIYRAKILETYVFLRIKLKFLKNWKEKNTLSTKKKLKNFFRDYFTIKISGYIICSLKFQ